MPAPRESTRDRVAAVEPVVRRVLASKVFDPHRLDDLVQETHPAGLESPRPRW